MKRISLDIVDPFRNRLKIYLKRKFIGFEKKLYAIQFLSTKRIPLPDFLGIGAMKAGTTWLYKNIACHPDLFLPRKKELYYFSIKYYNQTLRSYGKHFKDGRNKIKGEITPGYSIISKERIRFCHAIKPEMKLIFLMRNPIHRTWSEACMNLISKRNRRFEDVNAQKFFDYFRSGPCIKRSDYNWIIGQWMSVFPREQFFIGFYEDISIRPLELLHNLFEFLGVSTDVQWDKFPAKKLILPRYESYGGCESGYINNDWKKTNEFLPDIYRKDIESIHYQRIDELKQRFNKAIELWPI